MRLFVGGYTADMDGAAEGVGELHAGAADEAFAGSALAFAGTAARAGGSPSWLAAHPVLDVVYAALEGDGTVQAFRRTGPSSFAPLGAPVPAGSLVCHVAVSPDARFLLATCWGDGRVVRMRLDAAGRPSSPSIAPAAVDPYAASSMSSAAPVAPDDVAAAARALREAVGEEHAHLIPHADDEPPVDAPEPEPAAERVSRAHETVFLADGLVATTDMGLDLVRFWQPAGEGLRAAGQVVLPRGSGPRHAVWHPSGHLYVVTELSCEIFVLAPDVAGTWRIVSGTSLLGTVPGTDLAAELAASADGSFLYAGVRGSNTIAAVHVRGSGAELRTVALAEAGVDWPRHHVIARDSLLVAGQLSNEVALLPLDVRTGVPGRIRSRVAVPSPTSLLPARD